MKLQDHLDLLGQDAGMFAFHTKLPIEVIQRALDGKPITVPHAEQIAMKLSQHHGISVHPLDRQALKPEDIDGLVVIKSDQLKSKKGN
jgi:hypothetical protein